MMNEGLLAEAQELFPHKDLNALQTVGYRELFSYFENEISLEFAIDEIKKNTRRFAKRQLTWFKRNENTKWFDYLTDRKRIINYIDTILAKAN
jgi:tRNA dimethylallyltransferase